MMRGTSLFDTPRRKRLRSESPTYLRRLEAWQRFDAAHPEVFDLFRSKAQVALGKGFKHYSARTLMEVIRWHYDVGAKSGDFKLNDHYTPFYVRKLIETDSAFNGFFELRGEEEEQDAERWDGLS